jgi:Flp pilus assembly protein TadG
MLSFRQTVSQSAAEGARAAAVAPSSASNDQRIAAAKAAVTAALSSGAGGLTCSSPNVTCDVVPINNCGDGSGNDCMKVTVSYPYKDHSLLPIPGLGFAMPSVITYSAVAEVS